MNGFRWEVFKRTLLVARQNSPSRLLFGSGGSISSFIPLELCHFGSGAEFLNQSVGDKFDSSSTIYDPSGWNWQYLSRLGHSSY